MLRKILTNRYVIAGVIGFLLLFFVGIFGVKLTWSESLLLATVITVIGIGTLWWQEFWPF